MSFLSSRVGSIVLAFAALGVGACVDQPSPTAPQPPNVRPRFAVGDVILVSNTSGGADLGSLRAAVNQATGGEVIRFDPSLAGARITLDTTLTVPKNVTIEGPADKGIIISGGGKVRVLDIKQGATLVNLTITEAKADFGAGILATGPLVLDHSTVFGNEGIFGAGIRGDTITLINSTVTNNKGAGLTFEVSGVHYEFRGTLTLINSTVSHNLGGAGIGPFGASSTTPTVTLRNSIVSNNERGNCSLGPDGFVFEGKSISDDDTCGTGALVMLIADPLLGELADNGGPSMTRALDGDSPAINATDCDLAVDQRNVPRDAKCDIGAFEFVFTTIELTVDSRAEVDPETGSAIVSGTVRCSRDETFDLVVDLEQQQKSRRSSTVVNASRTIPIRCETTAQPWVALIATPDDAVFQNGGALASARTANTGGGVTSSAASAAVQLFWSRRK